MPVMAGSWSSLLPCRTLSRNVGEGWRAVTAWAEGGSDRERFLLPALEGVATSRGETAGSMALSMVHGEPERLWLQDGVELVCTTMVKHRGSFVATRLIVSIWRGIVITLDRQAIYGIAVALSCGFTMVASELPH